MKKNIFQKNHSPKKKAALTTNHGPGPLTTSFVSENDSSPTNNLILASSLPGGSSHNMPFEAEKVTTFVKPRHQLSLSEAELKEDIPRTLTTVDPNQHSSLVVYSYKERAFKAEPASNQPDPFTIHFALEGTALHKDSVEAKQQAQWEQRRENEWEQARNQALEEAVEAGEEAFFDDGEAKRGMRGGFKYCERAAQTTHLSTKDKSVGSEPPPVLLFSATCNQWEIYDAYLDQYRKQCKQQHVNSLAKDVPSGSVINVMHALPESKGIQTVHSDKLLRSLEMLERILTHNAEDDVYHDFKYFDETSDASRAQGSLLPLWHFTTEKTRRKQVTALVWNPYYNDLFAAGYGSYDFLRQGGGLICCFSLKNTATPQYVFSVEAGVMCLDFHPEHPFLLAVGCYDGSVLVFDVRNKVNAPVYASKVTTGKHTDPVWKVRWQTLEEGLLGGSSSANRELCFLSVAADGQVVAWLLSKNELKMEPLMQLKLIRGCGISSVISSSSFSFMDNTTRRNSWGLDGFDVEGEAFRLPTTTTDLASGSCFDFSPLPGQGHLFLVGTEEGTIQKCSKTYTGQYLTTYRNGHHMAVYAVRWNPFHPKLFLSCSADWTVKLWDHTQSSAPLLSFDLANAVGDLDWSPVSSTSFAAVTSDGRVQVFDLAVNKYEPICLQKIVKRAKLTHVAFNVHEPVLLVGDDRGDLTSFKLSPNLRNRHEPKDEAGNVLPHDTVRLQFNNVEKFLASVIRKEIEK